MNGAGPHEGRVEIFYNSTSTWGTVCVNDWSLNDGLVVCCQLGYPWVISVYKQAHFGEGTALFCLTICYVKVMRATLLSVLMMMLYHILCGTKHGNVVKMSESMVYVGECEGDVCGGQQIRWLLRHDFSDVDSPEAQVATLQVAFRT